MGHQVICPNCGTAINLDETQYAEILNQVKTAEFDAELKRQVSMVEAAQKSEANAELAKLESAKAQEILELKSKLKEIQTENDLAVAKAVAAEKDRAMRELADEKDRAMKELAEAKDRAAAALDTLKDQISQATLENSRLKGDLATIKENNESKLVIVRQNYEERLRDREETIERLKDLKAKMSTKMIGETLEQHCQNTFNQIRMTAYPRAYFDKDNKVSESGSKGDFIFRDYDEDGNEIVSIMFEMKNENETTASKHKNEHFFKELDKDRKEKKCEYAVLVTLLEADNEYYNAGIVDVSYQYEKMYVIRPQFFLPIISILTNAARANAKAKAELQAVRNQNIDITNFEEKIEAWKTSFSINSGRASANFTKAIEDIDKSIKALEDTKTKLKLVIDNFNTANNKLDDLTVKKLTRGNPTMTKMFEEIRGENEN